MFESDWNFGRSLVKRKYDVLATRECDAEMKHLREGMEGNCDCEENGYRMCVHG